jgi:mannose-6-phosphate isomerase-like protein (cupin superfamily)
MQMRVIRQADLPWSAIAHELVGDDHDLDISVILVDSEPGRGPSLHKHPYAEVFIVLEGEATVSGGDEELVARAGDILIVPAGEPHGFVSSGDGPLRQIDIHLSPRFETEWLENPPR